MTPSELKRLREVCDAATSGPWTWNDGDNQVNTPSGPVALTAKGIHNTQFIAEARSALPLLLDEVERLEKQIVLNFEEEEKVFDAWNKKVDYAARENKRLREAIEKTIARADDYADSWISKPVREALRGEMSQDLASFIEALKKKPIKNSDNT